MNKTIDTIKGNLKTILSFADSEFLELLIADSAHVLVAAGRMDGNWIQMARHLFGHWWWIVSILFGGHSRFALPLLLNNRGDVRGDFNR